MFVSSTLLAACQIILGLEEGTRQANTGGMGGDVGGASSTGGGPVGTGGDGGDGGAGGDGGMAPEEGYVVFTTEQTYMAGSDFTNIQGADMICNSDAQNASLPGTYVAWLSDGSDAAIDRIPSGIGPWYLPEGTAPVFPTTETIISGPMTAINVDANGDTVNAGTVVYTGTLANGEVSVGSHCDDWKGGDHDVTLGAVLVSSAWTNNQTTNCGPIIARLYCFQVSR